MKKYENIIKLLLLFVGLPLVVWHLALAKSYTLWKDVERKKEQLQLLQNRPINSDKPVEMINREMTIVDYITNKLKIGVDRYNSYIFCLKDSDYDVVTEEVRMIGKYNTLVRGLNSIEESGWTIFSQTFSIATDIRTKQEVLQLTIIVKDIKKRGGDNEK